MNQERYYTIRERPHGLSTSILTTRGSFYRPCIHITYLIVTPPRITAIDQIEASSLCVTRGKKKGGLHPYKRHHPHDPELLSFHSSLYRASTPGDRLEIEANSPGVQALQEKGGYTYVSSEAILFPHDPALLLLHMIHPFITPLQADGQIRSMRKKREPKKKGGYPLRSDISTLFN